METREEGDLEAALVGPQQRDEEVAEGSMAWRLCEEKQLFARQRGVLTAAFVTLGYGALVVFRNLAYYRYRVAGRLQDAGFQLLPEFGPSMMRFVDLPIHVMYLVDALVLLGALLGPAGVASVRKRLRLPVRGDAAANHPHVVNIMRRVSVVYALGHVLRAATYLSTSVPGSAEHCLPGAKLNPPQTLAECFYRVNNVNGNCGDLNFSGHMLFLLLSMGMAHRYGATSWQLPHMGAAHKTLLAVCLGLTLTQVVFIIMSRHHYTVDLVVAAYTVPLLWHFHNSVVLPEDLRVDRALVEKELRQDRLRPRWKRVVLALRTLVCLAVLIFASLVVAHGNFRFFGL